MYFTEKEQGRRDARRHLERYGIYHVYGI